MSDFDDDLRQRLTGAAGEIEQSALARSAPVALGRAIRRHRRGVVAQAAGVTFAVVLAATMAPRLWDSPAEVRAPFASGGSSSPTPSAPVAESPTPAPTASTSPSPTAPPVTHPATPPVVATASASTSPSPSPASVAPAACTAQPYRALATPQNVTVSLEMTDRALVAGDTVRMTIVVRNEGATPVQYTTGGYAYDFWVTDGTATRWVWSADKVFTMEVRNGTLEPGQELRHSETWDVTGCPGPGGEPGKPLRAGKYTAYTLFVSDAENGRGWASTPVHFEID